ncbi:hypothetical protein CDG77_26600 [Nostoc sp. 'Peltigera membranacea cyanobiont' 213]|uniref:hypothetical protein n=1 Tax=unclassified Nostoc TaxID=2593658 RepID=UPI000B9F6A29|nr:hypothetical protein [Nostoc sp. 'Peltigera membranacea cyanobiont' 213]OYD87936.1 hypothetical protein CDG77_26600 [Nostoc sp. 'Peltigera membranacea cyanobiont' 213]
MITFSSRCPNLAEIVSTQTSFNVGTSEIQQIARVNTCALRMTYLQESEARDLISHPVENLALVFSEYFRELWTSLAESDVYNGLRLRNLLCRINITGKLPHRNIKVLSAN